MRLGVRRTAAVIGAALLVLAVVTWHRYLRVGPAAAFADPIDHFKYGSIGAEVNGIPFIIWKALPILCGEQLPNGYASFGFIEEPRRPVPIGVSVRQYRIARVGFNCATCHSMRVEGLAHPVLGAPAAQLDLAAYTRFVLQCGTGPSFTPARVMEAIDKSGVYLDPLDRLVYRYFVVPMTRAGIAQRGVEDAWMARRPAHGPGRTDALNPWRQRFAMRPENDTVIATVDFPSVWNQHVREGMWLHWDADNNSLAERNLSAALAGGATETSLDHESIGRVTEWLEGLKPPSFPFAIDRASAEMGRRIYEREGCSNCHDVDGAHVGQSTPLATIATDPSRVDALSAALLMNMLTVGTDYPWRFTHYRRPDGYANSPLDGVWARAPYLHNGSVPTLDDLLRPAVERPREFWTGCRTFDAEKVGFACTAPFLFRVAAPGNGNGGHEYGSTLPAEERASLLEYLKTL